jgi:hypothetical protein
MRGVDVLVEPEHEGGERRVAVVVDGDRLAADDAMRRQVEPGLDGVVDAVLPVVRSRSACGVARSAGKGASDRVGQRDVSPDGTFRDDDCRWYDGRGRLGNRARRARGNGGHGDGRKAMKRHSYSRDFDSGFYHELSQARWTSLGRRVGTEARVWPRSQRDASALASAATELQPSLRGFPHRETNASCRDDLSRVA